MTFDDQLKRALDTLTDRLRDEVDRQVRAAMDELSASSRQHADDLRQAVEADTRRIVEEDTRRTLEEQTRQAVEDSRRAAEEDTRQKIEETRRHVEEETRRRVEEDAQRRTEEAVAAALAAVPPPPPVVLPTADDRLLEGIRAMDAARSLTDVLAALLSAVAGDGAGAGIWLSRGERLELWRSTGIEQPDADIALGEPRAIADAARTNLAAWDDGFAMPLAIAGQAVAVLYANSGPSDHPLNPHAAELLARHAASRLETITAFKTARAMTEHTAPRAASAAAAAATGSGSAPDSEEQVAAQRYARLLVSEIKLYHEQAVVEGRRDRDLATRLGGEIARARVMYEERVPAHVRERSDHFQAELVRTLADGDSTLIRT